MDEPWINVDEDTFSFVISELHRDVRLDQFLARTVESHSRSRITAAIRAGSVTVNGDPVKPGYRLRVGDLICGEIVREREPSAPVPQDVDFSVLVEDASFLVLAKPAGLVVHPGSGNHDRTLVNGLLHRYRDIEGTGDEERPGIVHRLDKDTSGIMVVARNPHAHAELSRQFKDRVVAKTYCAIVHGLVEEDSGRIVAPIGRHPIKRQKMAIREHDGRYAASSWKRIQTFTGHCLVEVAIETGRTHQIRVHLASIGHPVAGDRMYGSHRDNCPFPRQMLHSWKLRFNHPETGDPVHAEAPFPDDFRTSITMLGDQ